MPLLQVRDFPEDIYEEIAYESRRQHRTIAQQTIVLIQQGLNGGDEESNKERTRRALERTFAREVPQAAKDVDVVAWIREDRDSNHGHNY
jgi:biopolymer transport protein ExbB/TolQ